MNNLAKTQVSQNSIDFKLECYGASRTQEGKTANEDAFLIGRGNIPFVALCDGAGNAEQTAKRVLRFFQRLFNEGSLDRSLMMKPGRNGSSCWIHHCWVEQKAPLSGLQLMRSPLWGPM